MPLPFTALAQFIAERLNRSEKRRLRPRCRRRRQIGNYGERVAAAFLRRQGYRVLTRNYKTTRGEIDLVCRHGEILVFVEVRTRAEVELRSAPPKPSTPARRKHFAKRRASATSNSLEREDITYRFDAVEVELKTGAIPGCTLHPELFCVTIANRSTCG